MRALLALAVAILALGTGQARAATGGTTSGSTVHRVPEVPIEIDGVRVGPEEVNEYDGKPLYYVLDARVVEERVGRIFTTREKLHRYMRRSAGDGPIDARARQARPGRGTEAPVEQASPSGSTSYSCRQPLNGYASLYEHPDWCGQVIDSAYGQAEPDFTRLDCYLWWCTNFNDKASSADVYTDWIGPAWPVLYEHTRYRGRALALQPGYSYNADHFGWYGLNDIASSLRYEYP